MQNRNRSIKILEEIVAYFLHHQILDLDIRFNSGAEVLEISASGLAPYRPEDLDHLESLLNEPRRPEFEDYYWGLLGTSSNRNELRLLGSLVDWGHTSFENGRLTIQVKRTH